MVLLSVGLAGAELPSDVPLEQRPDSVEYDETTDQFLVANQSEDFSQCGRQRLRIVDQSGEEGWHVPAPVPCHWTMHEGTLFVSSDDLIRSFDMVTGELIRSWSTPDGVISRQLFIDDGLLWFNHDGNRATDLFTWLPEGVGTLNPLSDEAPTLRVLGNSQLVATSADARIQWLTDPNGLIRFDHADPTNGLRNDDIHPPITHRFVLTDDGQFIYALGTDVIVFNATTLQQIGRYDEPGSANPYRLFELPNGNMVGTAQGGSNAAVVFASGTVNPIATGPVLGENALSDGMVVGDHLALAVSRNVGDVRKYFIQFYDLTPSLISPPTTYSSGSEEIDANNPRTVLMNVHFADAVDTITINGQSANFAPTNDFGRTEWLLVELPALPEGTHRIVLDGPLGRSLDFASNTLTIAPALPRAELEVLIRGDSATGEVEVWVVCNSGQFADTDISEKQLMRAGSRLTFQPIVGHTCGVQFSRQESGGIFDNDWQHVTTGLFDPTTDPGAWTMLDAAEWLQSFTVQPGSNGVAAFMPSFDQTVVWTYSYGFGSSSRERTPVTIRCADDSTTYDTHLGYWRRSLVDRNAPCLLEHTTPVGAEFSGFGVVDISGRTRPPFQRQESLVLDAGATSYVIVVYDVYPHPSEHNGAFVRQQYLDFLGRVGDPGGLRHWEDALNTGTRARTDLVQQFLDSPEFGGTVAPVNRLYQAYFDRAPDREGLFFWVNWIRDGRTLGQVSDEFARSAEFERTYGTLSDEDFIDLVYTNVLGRPADARGRAFWIERMATGTTRGQLMANFSESPEFIEQTRAAVLVESLYQGLLQRSPDPQGFAFWTGQVDSGASIDSLIAGMLSSDEYYNRFDNIIDQQRQAGATRSFEPASHFIVDPSAGVLAGDG